METGSDDSLEQDKATVTKEFEEPSENRKKNLWWKEENQPRLNKAMKIIRNPVVNVVCDAACLEWGKDPFPQQTYD